MQGPSARGSGIWETPGRAWSWELQGGRLRWAVEPGVGTTFGGRRRHSPGHGNLSVMGGWDPMHLWRPLAQPVFLCARPRRLETQLRSPKDCPHQLSHMQALERNIRICWEPACRQRPEKKGGVSAGKTQGVLCMCKGPEAPGCSCSQKGRSHGGVGGCAVGEAGEATETGAERVMRLVLLKASLAAGLRWSPGCPGGSCHGPGKRTGGPGTGRAVEVRGEVWACC